MFKSINYSNNKVESLTLYSGIRYYHCQQLATGRLINIITFIIHVTIISHEFEVEKGVSVVSWLPVKYSHDWRV